MNMVSSQCLFTYKISKLLKKIHMFVIHRVINTYSIQLCLSLSVCSQISHQMSMWVSQIWKILFHIILFPHVMVLNLISPESIFSISFDPYNMNGSSEKKKVIFKLQTKSCIMTRFIFQQINKFIYKYLPKITLLDHLNSGDMEILILGYLLKKRC